MFHEKLRELRAQAGKTQKDLADYLMISPQSVSKWEMGESLPSMEYLPKIAQFLSCTPNDFFDREEYQSVELEKKEDKEFLKKSQANRIKEEIRVRECHLLHLVQMECRQEEQEMIDRKIQETRCILQALHKAYKELTQDGAEQQENN
jgi:transcriptional regulator with XRE-family HTH domain